MLASNFTRNTAQKERWGGGDKERTPVSFF